MKHTLIALMLVGAAGIAGCSGMSAKSGNSGSTADEGAASRGARMGGGPQGTALGDPLSQRIFYFPYDSTDISPADREALIAQAKYLSTHPKVKVEIMGNADERGTREYNLALGERRAQAIQSILLLQGMQKNRTETISFGQEKPVALCHDESCWHLNRRVELVYPGSAPR